MTRIFDAVLPLECFDILALTEMKAKVGVIPDHGIMELPGYDLFTSNFSREATRGTGIYVRKEFVAKQVYPREDSNFEDSTWVRIPTLNAKVCLLNSTKRSRTMATAVSGTARRAGKYQTQ